MSPVHFHLFFSHFPIAGVFIGLVILLFGRLFKQEAVVKTGLWLLFIASFSVFAMNASGEEAEEVVEHIEGVSHHLIHEHEEAAEKVVWVALITGLMSLISLWAIQTGRKFANRLLVIVSLFAFLAAGAIAYTAKLGGSIRHAEELGEVEEVPPFEKEEPSDKLPKNY